MGWRKEAAFAEKVTKLVLEHAEHGGWYEDASGLHCAKDNVLVIPSPSYLQGGSTRESL